MRLFGLKTFFTGKATVTKVMHYDIADTGSIEYVYEIITNWNELLTEEIGSSFKWRLIYLRAVIDHELLHNDFIPKNLSVSRRR